MNKPNIIYMNCDDLGYGDIGCYGSQVNRTPTIDSLAKEGIRFTDFYSASPLCSPSRGALMTGCYPMRIDFECFDGYKVLFPGQGIGINHNEYTLPQLMKDNGYKTMIVGKWHCGDQEEFLPQRYGFDHYYGLPYSNDFGRQKGRMTGCAPSGYKLPMPPLPLIEDSTVIQEQPDLHSLTERYVEKAVGFIRESAKEQKPFFLYFAHMQVHRPNYAPARFERNSNNGIYGACVECVDWSMQVLIEELKDTGLLDNTIVIFTSDNGSLGKSGASNGPLRGAKATSWEGGSRVPFIFYWKDKISPSENNSLCSNMDILPTFAELLGSRLSDNVIDGLSFMPIIDGEAHTINEDRPFFFYRETHLEAVRLGKWKLHFCKMGEKYEALYDLSSDIGEQVNVISEHPEVVNQLSKYAHQARQALGDSFTGTKGSEVRPAGRCADPKPLTVYRENYPYIDAMYDREDFG